MQRADLRQILQGRFNAKAAEHFGILLEDYWDSGHAPPHLLSELETNEEGKIWAFIW